MPRRARTTAVNAARYNAMVFISSLNGLKVDGTEGDMVSLWETAVEL